jgi:SAM-dependent methyltransferase
MNDVHADRMRRHNARQRDYYRQPQRKPRMRPASSPYVQRQIDRLFQVAGLESGMKVLDVGCGMGRYTLQLVERGMEVSGLDLSPELLDRLAQYDGGRYGVALYCGDIADPPSDLPRDFDALIGFFTLHHMHDLRRCFRSMATIVKPGGIIGFVEPNGASPLYYIQIAATPSMSWSAEKGLLQMHDATVRRAMTHGGLSDFKSQSFGFFPPLIANVSGAAAVEAMLERVPMVRPGLSFKVFAARRPRFA